MRWCDGCDALDRGCDELEGILCPVWASVRHVRWFRHTSAVSLTYYSCIFTPTHHDHTKISTHDVCGHQHQHTSAPSSHQHHRVGRAARSCHGISYRPSTDWRGAASVLALCRHCWGEEEEIQEHAAGSSGVDSFQRWCCLVGPRLGGV